MKESIDITITIVSWNTEKLLRDCLKSLLTENIEKIAEIHVVDNDSHDGSVAMVKREFPQVRIFANKENLGFARANNQSWKEAKGRYWLLLNSDTIVKDGAVEKLIEFMDSHPKAGMATAKLLNPDGSPQYCAQREQKIFNSLLEFSRLHKILPRRTRGDLLLGSYFGYDHPQKLDWTWGTALIVRREAIKDAGILSENYFMYGEDLEWSLRMRKFGWEIWFCPDAEIIHYGGQSSQQTWNNSEKNLIILNNCYQAIEEHRGKLYTKLLQTTLFGISAIEILLGKFSKNSLRVENYRALNNYYLQKIKNKA